MPKIFFQTSCMLFQHSSTISLAGAMSKVFLTEIPCLSQRECPGYRRIMLIDPGFIFYNTALNRNELFTAYFNNASALNAPFFSEYIVPFTCW
jgi:hypothetical protein